MPAVSSPLRRRRKVIGFGAIGCVVLGLGAWGLVSLLTPNTFTFDGTISVSANNSSYAETISVVPTSNGGCRLFNGYEDIATGGQVTVYAADGKLLRSGALLGSRYDSSTRSCAYRFRVDNVPEQDMYQVEVTHRGKVAVSLAEAKAGTAALTLGG